MVGYVGPACVAVDDLLYMHGFYIRRLTEEEIHGFFKYQSALEVHRQVNEALANGKANVANNSSLLSSPPIPSFCNGLDDTVEVVLDGCTVKNNQVYIADRLIRPLNSQEQDKIGVLLNSGPVGSRIRRATSPLTKQEEEAVSTPQNDISDLLEHFLNVNSSVAERFYQSPKYHLNENKQLNMALTKFDAEIFGTHSAQPPSIIQHPEGISDANSSTANKAHGDILRHPTEILLQPQQTPAYPPLPPPGSLNMNDPLLLHLLHSLAGQQQSVNQINRQQQNSSPLSQQSPSQPILPSTTSGDWRSDLLAVPLSSLTAGSELGISQAAFSTLGLMPANHGVRLGSESSQQVPSQPPSWSIPAQVIPSPPPPQPFAFAPMGGAQANSVQMHPGRQVNSADPMLPNEICTAHILDPFRQFSQL
uniref:Pepsin inhibitor-3-like repeated domain-containing protein n=1 Tax=Ditylenchus dipsaci TaxID=166011 RepID=A0A915CRI1_9BILA